MAEPITLAEARAQVNIVDAGDTTFDAFLTSLIAPARAYVERVSGYFFVADTRTVTFERFGDYLEIARRPIASITTVEYIDTDGAEQEYTGFIASFGSYSARIHPTASGTFPDIGGAITVTYEADALATDTAEYLTGKRAMLLLIGFWFDNRGEVPLSKDAEFAMTMLLDDLRPVSAY